MERLNIDELLDAYDNIMRVTTSGTPLYQRAESVRYYLQQLLHYQKLDASFDHIRDLVEAEQAGRMVVLPCKVGDTVFDIGDGTAYATRVLNFSYFGDHWACRTVSSYPDLEEFGTRIFLTREEAEAALQKGGPHETDSV